MKHLKKLLLPLSWLYGLGLWFRHGLYNAGFLSEKEFNLPIICVGNLSVGGTGKTPMVEYLIRLVGTLCNTAVLSRGYGRKTKGYLLAQPHNSAGELGDEPYQYKQKFPSINVAVSESRVKGVVQLLKQTQTEAIILDDAFQHRAIKAGLNILLTPYYELFVSDNLLPSGNLRDLKSRAQNAQIIVVTKCPANITSQERKNITAQLKPLPFQKVFFAAIAYGSYVANTIEQMSLQAWLQEPFILVTGIANALPLIQYLKEKEAVFEHWNFTDHHQFSSQEIAQIKAQKRVLTTEKDFSRLREQTPLVWYLPIQTEIIAEKEAFNNEILSYIKGTKNPHL